MTTAAILALADLIITGAGSVTEAVIRLRQKDIITVDQAKEALAKSFMEKDTVMSEYDAKIAAIKALQGGA